MPVFKSIREFAGGPVSALVGVVSLLLTTAAVIKFVDGSKSAWMWLFLGAIVLVFFAFWRFHMMRLERDQAASVPASVTTKLVEMGSGSEVSGTLNVGGNLVRVGASASGRTPKSRWFRRLLTDEERADLADRCETAAAATMAHLTRLGPDRLLGLPMTSDERRQNEYDRAAHRAETERLLLSEHVPRIIDLLDECVESGFYLNAKTEEFRVSHFGAGHPHSAEEAALELGIVALRVRRNSRRLP